MALASTLELNRDPRWNGWLKSGRAPQPAPRELGRGGAGGGQVHDAERSGQSAAPRRGGRGGEGWGGTQLPYPLLPGPHSPAPKWEDHSCPLPFHTPATCPVPEANREEALSQRSRAHNFAASGRARVGAQGSSYPRLELGELLSPPLCGGAAAAAQGAASPASGRRWPRSPRPPALSASLGFRPSLPPRARPAPVLNGQLPWSSGRTSGLRRLSSRAGPGPQPPAERRSLPPAQAPALRLPGAAAHLEAAPAPPWRPAWGRHLLPRSPGPRALSGVDSAAAALGSAWPEAGPGPQRPPLKVPWAGPLRRREARGSQGGCGSPGALAPSEGTPR